MNVKELKEWLKDKDDELVVYENMDYGVKRELELKYLDATPEKQRNDRGVNLLNSFRQKEKTPSKTGIKTMLDLQFE
jgi:hypothetical protein